MEEIKNHEIEEEAELESTTMEKVYIAVGNDIQEGYKTIDWAIKKWNNIPISIVLLHLCNISQDFVYTPCIKLFILNSHIFFCFLSYKPNSHACVCIIVGKLPASSVSEEKLQVLRKYEEQKIDKLLSKYVAFCEKV